MLWFVPTNAEFMRYADKAAEVMEFPDEWVTGIGTGTYNIVRPLYDPVSKWYNDTSTTAAEVAMTGDQDPLSIIYQLLHSFNTLLKTHRHPLADRLPMVSIEAVIVCLIVYFCGLVVFYVIGKVLGKGKYRLLGAIHNLNLLLVSLYMAVGLAVTAAASFGYSLWNNEISNSPGGKINDWRLAKMLWVFYISKVPEFIDTFLMMLKQNYRQISFLHVYHHASMVLMWFIVQSCAPGGDAYWSTMLNASVHVVMYGYYFGTIVFTDDCLVRRLLNKFKFMITHGQMAQFVINCVQSVYCLYIAERCKSPRFLFHLLFWYMFTMLVLFANFLQKNKSKNETQASQEKKSINESKKQR